MKRKRPRTKEEKAARARRRLIDPNNTSNLHHLNPVSRQNEIKKLFGPYLNAILLFYNWTEEIYVVKINTIKIVKKDVHEAWNDLFSNIFAWQAANQVRLWSNKTLDCLIVKMDELQERAWNTLFGENATPKEAIEIIQRDWWPEFPSKSDFKRFLSKKKGRGK